MSKQDLNMTQGHPGKLLMSFALPLMLGNIFQQLYTVMDTMIVGRGIDMDALAALGTVDWLNWMFLGLVQGVTQGFSVRMSQNFGSGNREELHKTLGIAVRLSIIIGFVVTGFAQMFLGFFLKLLKVSEELRPQAELYSRIILGGIPAMLFYNLTASILRSIGDSKTPLAAMIVAALTNIILDCVAVFFLKWGIAGAAGATVLAQFLAGIICTVRIVKTPLLRFERRHLAPDRLVSRQMFGLGVTLAMQNVIIAVGGMVLQSIVNGFDTAFIAGYTASNKLFGLLEIAAISYGYAITTYTGQNFGAMLWERIRKGVRWASVISLLTSVLIGSVMILFGRWITMLFISSESAAEAAAAGNTAYTYLVVMAVCLPALYMLYVYRSALQGMGYTRMPLLSGAVEFLLRVGGAVLVGYTGYQMGIFYTEVSAWFGALILLAIAYAYHMHRLKD